MRRLLRRLRDGALFVVLFAYVVVSWLFERREPGAWSRVPPSNVPAHCERETGRSTPDLFDCIVAGACVLVALILLGFGVAWLVTS